ncbi:MAG TPA: hypothetical protein PLE74_01195 [Candidatus Cloacimonadota bacterium]|nr:hypothetical protein [Candidatus Cloacimonadota bacterium]
MPSVKFKVRFKTISFDKEKFTSDYMNGLKELTKKAARAFALAASNRVHVDTGMARSTFLGKVETFEGGVSDANEYLGLKDSPASINVSGAIQRTRKDADKAKYWRKGSMFPGIRGTYIRTPEAGAERGLFMFQIIGSKISFLFFPSVRHYLYWENKWRSMDIGRKAFSAYIQANKKKYIPKLNKYYKMSYRSA